MSEKKNKDTYFVNERGEKVRIIVDFFYMSGYIGGVEYRVKDILFIPPGKRKPISVASQMVNDYKYRNTPFGSKEREDFIRQEFLKYCTEEQIQEAVMEEYRKMMPSADAIHYHIF